MKVAVFGATGGLGRQVVRQAVGRGWQVVAHVRDPAKLPQQREAVSVVQGHLSDLDSVQRALEGVDAAITCFGHVKGEEPATYERAMSAIVESLGNRRLVAISGAGLELPGDEGGLARRLIITALKLFAPGALEGKQREFAVLEASSTPYTAVRVARMVEGSPEGTVAVDPHRVSGKTAVAYADVATWMLDQVHDDTWVRRAPFVSGA
jgi:hypothetical protein